jgi:MFS family permease
METSLPTARSTFYATDGPYAFRRLGLALLMSTIICVGMWSVVVVMPEAQRDFGAARSSASLAYTVQMIGLAAGTLVMGRFADRAGIVPPLLVSAALLGLGYSVAGLAPNLFVFSAAHVVIGFGTGTGFGPMVADTSHWFFRRRGIAVVVVAAGNYLSGTIWPLAISAAMPMLGWRWTYVGIGIFIVATTVPLSLLMRRRPSAASLAHAEAAARAAQTDIGLPPMLLLGLLMAAGFSCCVAMAMPQVHIVSYCGDLGYGVARGSQMLSLMLFLGVVSRIGSGFVSDVIGSSLTLVIGSFMQGLALFLYAWYDGLSSLFVVSGLFGLFQGGIVPMYAIICRELMPPKEAGARIGLVLSATIFGMAFGGYISGVIYDFTYSYRAAFINGVVWNVLNLAICGFLLWRRSHAMSLAIPGE